MDIENLTIMALKFLNAEKEINLCENKEEDFFISKDKIKINKKTKESKDSKEST